MKERKLSCQLNTCTITNQLSMSTIKVNYVVNSNLSYSPYHKKNVWKVICTKTNGYFRNINKAFSIVNYHTVTEADIIAK